MVSWQAGLGGGRGRWQMPDGGCDSRVRVGRYYLLNLGEGERKEGGAEEQKGG
jgi:hypothetical protein